MKKFLLAASVGILSGAVVTTQIAAPLLAQEAAKTSNVYEQLDLFGDIFERIRAQYVEPVDESKLIEAAINGMLTSLDPHSSYLPPEDAANMRVQTRGDSAGSGSRSPRKRASSRSSRRSMAPPRMRPASRRAISSPMSMANRSSGSPSMKRLT